MFDEDTSRTELLAKISMSDDPKELLNIYNSTPLLFGEILSRLLSLRASNEFLSVWNQVLHKLKAEPKELKKVSFNPREIKEIAESQIADEFLLSLLELVTSYGISVEAYRVCLLASEIIQLRKQFPSKNWVISYFTLVATLFKTGSHYSSYLNALNVLKEHQDVQMSKKEYDFYCKIVQIKAEQPIKELFCGLKLVSVENITLNFTETEFTFDPLWNDIFNLRIPNTLENFSFLARNNFKFEADGNNLKISEGACCKVISRVFEIANDFKYIAPVVVEETFEEEKIVKKSEVKPTQAEPVQQVVVPKVEFKNRFSTLYKKFKLVHKYADVSFDDSHFDARSLERENRAKKISEGIENEKKRLSVYSEVLNELKAELKAKIDEKLKAERAKAEEAAKLEEQAMLEERKANLWRNNRSTATATPETSSVYRPPVMNFQRPQSNDQGIYRPNFAAIDSLIKNKSPAPSTEQRQSKTESPSTPAPTTSSGPWRKRSGDSNQNQTK